MLKQKVLRSGSSLVVVVPSDFVKRAGVELADEVDVDIDALRGEVVYRFKKSSQLPLSSSFVNKKKKSKRRK